MNVFLVGNGFDLHHCFPTRYIDFLQTVQFLINYYDASYATVGDVFGASALHVENSFIHSCYEKHSQVYNSTKLQSEMVYNIINRAKENMWFKYLSKCVTEDIRWIDFEKEIQRVLVAFNSFFDYEGKLSLLNNKVTFNFSEFPDDVEDRYILSQFNFFFSELTAEWTGRSRIMYVDNAYIIEKVVGSHSYHIAEEDIISYLYSSLCDLADILREYLLYFVDSPSTTMTNLDIRPHFVGLPTPNRVYSFNYTNSFELLYENNMIDHIHGNTNTDIVLGINPDEYDMAGNTDTTFLQFKKYFQRIFLKTDESFLQQMISFRRLPRANNSQLYVIGHSLDSTDEDVIKQIFDSAKSITILYHSETSVKSQIRNLVEMYGKEGLDNLREQKNLKFVPQPEIQWSTATGE